jgi:hypothetical protein
MTQQIEVPGVEMLDLVQKIDKLVELIVAIPHLDVAIQVALLDVRNAALAVVAGMEAEA